MVRITRSRDATRSLVEQARQRQKAPTYVWGIPWGFEKLDKLTGGIHKEQMAVLIARPGVGKSAIAGQIALNVAEYFKAQGAGQVVRVVSLEMSADTWFKRMACYRSGVSLWRVDSGYISDEDLEKYALANDAIHELPFEVIDEGVTLDLIIKFIERDGTCGFWILDHIGIIGGGDGGNAWAALTHTSHEIRKLSKHVAPSLILSQMNRKSEERQDKRPMLSDVSGSDGIGADARIVIGLYREDIYQKLEQEERNEPKPAEVIVLKSNNGSLGTIDFTFIPTRAQWLEAEA